jgi:hypothetical protein
VLVVTLYDCAGTIATYGLMDDGMTAYVPGINCILSVLTEDEIREVERAWGVTR